jgi:hypothetical protein
MSEASSESVVANRAAWIEEHKVGWRLGPLSKHVKGRGVVQTGYELVLFGRFHPAAGKGHEAMARALHEGLRSLAVEALGPAPPEVLLCVLPFSRWVVPADRCFTIEVELTVIGSLAHLERLPAPAETRQRIATLEATLRGMGLHRPVPAPSPPAAPPLGGAPRRQHARARGSRSGRHRS